MNYRVYHIGRFFFTFRWEPHLWRWWQSYETLTINSFHLGPLHGFRYKKREYVQIAEYMEGRE